MKQKWNCPLHLLSFSFSLPPPTPAWVLQRCGRLSGDPVQPGEPVEGHAGGAGTPLADGGGAADHGLLCGGVPGWTHRGGAASRGAVRAAQHTCKGESWGRHVWERKEIDQKRISSLLMQDCVLLFSLRLWLLWALNWGLLSPSQIYAKAFCRCPRFCFVFPSSPALKRFLIFS